MDTFKEFTRTHQALLHQVFFIQKALREITLGAQAWQGMADRRIELRTGYHVKVSTLMTLVSLTLVVLLIVVLLIVVCYLVG